MTATDRGDGRLMVDGDNSAGTVRGRRWKQQPRTTRETNLIPDNRNTGKLTKNYN